MSNWRKLGQRNRVAIVKYLAQKKSWATIREITEKAEISMFAVTLAHCNNLVTEGILERREINSMGKSSITFRYRRRSR
jgi:predicted DNA-binding transcriptional regulator